MRAVLDANVIISAILSPSGTPARILAASLSGAFELFVSPQLIEELNLAFAYPNLRKRVSAEDADEFLAWLMRHATVAPDSGEPPPVRSSDPDDDYLLALAEHVSAVLVSGDHHLLDMIDVPICSPRAFAELLERGG